MDIGITFDNSGTQVLVSPDNSQSVEGHGGCGVGSRREADFFLQNLAWRAVRKAVVRVMRSSLMSSSSGVHLDRIKSSGGASVHLAETYLVYRSFLKRSAISERSELV
jgi:hypothetical protein